MKSFSHLSLFSFIILTSFCVRHNNENVKDYLAIPGPISYNETSFNLVWSDHPNENYYKQQYLPVDEKRESYNQMIIVEVIAGSVSSEEAVRLKISELNHRKKTDPFVSYKFMEMGDKGEYVLDFVISTGSGDGAVIEWNAYRYVDIRNTSGNDGILLFGYNKRSFGMQATIFLEELKQKKSADINSLSRYELPDVKL